MRSVRDDPTHRTCFREASRIPVLRNSVWSVAGSAVSPNWQIDQTCGPVRVDSAFVEEQNVLNCLSYGKPIWHENDSQCMARREAARPLRGPWWIRRASGGCGYTAWPIRALPCRLCLKSEECPAPGQCRIRMSGAEGRLSGVNYFFRSTTTIIPDERQLLSLSLNFSR